jgi:hypothetical protein
MAVDTAKLDALWRSQGNTGDRPVGWFGTGGSSDNPSYGTGQSASGFVPSVNTQQVLDSQKQQESDFIKRYTSAVSGMKSTSQLADEIGGSLNLPTLRSNAQSLTATLDNIPTVQKQATRGFDVNNNQLDRIISAEQSKLAPVAQKAVTQQQNAENDLSTRLGYAVQDQQKTLLPYEKEASLLSDRLARETTMYSTQMQSELDLYMDSLRAGRELTAREQARLEELADREDAYQKEKDMYVWKQSQQTKSNDADWFSQAIDEYYNGGKQTAPSADYQDILYAG